MSNNSIKRINNWWFKTWIIYDINQNRQIIKYKYKEMNEFIIGKKPYFKLILLEVEKMVIIE